MTQLTNPATHNHPNFVRAQAASDASRLGDYGPTFDMLADEIILENGPGAGPWHIARGKEDMALGLIEFSAALGDTFHQDGRCAYADDRVIINLIHETGKAPAGTNSWGHWPSSGPSTGTTARRRTGSHDWLKGPEQQAVRPWHELAGAAPTSVSTEATRSGPTSARKSA